jgi:secreted trypsin-like serine protease
MSRLPALTDLCLSLLLLIFASLPAQAVVGGAGPDTPAPDSPWAGVGVVDNGKGQFSGALIGPRHVLTAAHVVKGKDVAEIVFRLNLGAGNTPALRARAVHIHPGYRGTKRNIQGVWYDDLAIVELADPAPAGVPAYDLYADFHLLKSMVALVGYGRGGDGVKGTSQPGGLNYRRVGHNRIDILLLRDPAMQRPEVFLFDFDGPDFGSNAFKPDLPINASLGADMEATFAGGDSGAPVFVFDAGKWKVVGVAAFVLGQDENRGQFGSLGGGMLVPAYADWIRAVRDGGSDGGPP